MVRRLLLGLALVALALSGCSSSPSWHSYTSVAGRYTVEMPGNVRESRDRALSAVGRLYVHFATAVVGATTYSVAYVDYPPEAITSDDEVLDFAVEGVRMNVAGEVARKAPSMLGPHPGREYEIRYDHGRVMRGRTYFVGARVYHVAASSDFRGEFRADPARFLDSFRVETIASLATAAPSAR